MKYNKLFSIFNVPDIYTMITDTQLSFNKLKFEDFSFNSAKFKLFLNITNNSPINFNIISQEYDVLIDGKKISEVNNKKPILIKKNSTSVLQYDVNIIANDLNKELFDFFGSILSSTKTPVITLLIKVKIKLFGIVFTKRFTYSIKLSELIKQI